MCDLIGCADPGPGTGRLCPTSQLVLTLPDQYRGGLVYRLLSPFFLLGGEGQRIANDVTEQSSR